MTPLDKAQLIQRLDRLKRVSSTILYSLDDQLVTRTITKPLPAGLKAVLLTLRARAGALRANLIDAVLFVDGIEMETIVGPDGAYESSK